MLPWLLRAIKQGEQTVRLDGGTLGIISQAGLPHALFASEPKVTVCLASAG